MSTTDETFIVRLKRDIELRLAAFAAVRVWTESVVPISISNPQEADKVHAAMERLRAALIVPVQFPQDSNSEFLKDTK